MKTLYQKVVRYHRFIIIMFLSLSGIMFWVSNSYKSEILKSLVSNNEELTNQLNLEIDDLFVIPQHTSPIVLFRMPQRVDAKAFKKKRTFIEKTMNVSNKPFFLIDIIWCPFFYLVIFLVMTSLKIFYNYNVDLLRENHWILVLPIGATIVDWVENIIYLGYSDFLIPYLGYINGIKIHLIFIMIIIILIRLFAPQISFLEQKIRTVGGSK